MTPNTKKMTLMLKGSRKMILQNLRCLAMVGKQKGFLGSTYSITQTLQLPADSTPDHRTDTHLIMLMAMNSLSSGIDPRARQPCQFLLAIMTGGVCLRFRQLATSRQPHPDSMHRYKLLLRQQLPHEFPACRSSGITVTLQMCYLSWSHRHRRPPLTRQVMCRRLLATMELGSSVPTMKDRQQVCHPAVMAL